MTRLLLTNARVVLEDRVVEPLDVRIEDGIIAAFDPDTGSGARVVDLAGCTLIPGLVDLHCDALEKEVEPRPRVQFPLDFACRQADRRNAMAGITTVFHALSFANHELGVRNNNMAADIARRVHVLNPRLLVDNRIHTRFEVTDDTAPARLVELIEGGSTHLLSFMDHSPGQGQFRDVEAYRAYLERTYGTSGVEVDAILARKTAAARGTFERMQHLAGVAREHGIALASHDDDRPSKIDTVATLGVSISEFPVNLETAQAARKAGIATIFGAPNVLRGGSQSGNMRALDAVQAGVADCLCGDYSPAALLPAILLLPALAGIELARAIALVTVNPARTVGLIDRGVIAVGQRADLVAYRSPSAVRSADAAADFGGVERVWVAGREVLTAGAGLQQCA